MHRRAIRAVMTAAVLVALPTHPAAAATAAVTIQNFAFMPQSLTVAPGTTVTWTMKDSPPTQHTVTSDDGSWSSQDLSFNQTYPYTFTTPGTYGYHCNIHSYMTGTIIVSGSTPTPTPTHHTTPTPTPTHHSTPPPTVQATHGSTPPPTRAPATAPPTSAGSTAAVDTTTRSPATSVLAEPARRTSSKRSSPWLAIVVIVVLAAGAGGVVFMRFNRTR